MLIKLLVPWFFFYLEQTEGGLTLMFCHRWLLVCLKREFTEEDSLAIWVACWTNYETPVFHLFVCVAIVAVYGQKAVDQNMNINELMVHFNTLSHFIPSLTSCPETWCCHRLVDISTSSVGAPRSTAPCTL